MWYAACYRHTRAQGDTAPYPGGAALALMKAIFICLCQLAIMTRELALLTLNRCKARSSSIDVSHAVRTGLWTGCPSSRGNVVRKSCHSFVCFTCHLHDFVAVQPASTALQIAAYICAKYPGKATFLRQ